MLISIKFLIFHFLRLIVKIIYHDSAVFIAKIKFIFDRKISLVSVEKGKNEHNNNNYAIFLIYQPNEISWYVKNALDSLNDAKINVVVVVNHEIDEAKLLYLKEKSNIVIVRNNKGFDIGAFRDSTLYLNSLNINISRLIYINDSVYFFNEGLLSLFLKLAESKSDICAPFENWEIHYHIQSFCFSVSGRIFKNDTFQNFWKNYVSVNSRLWAINEGEVGLSRTIVPLADSIEIIYRPNNLRAPLDGIQDLESRANLIRMIPIPFRTQTSEIFSMMRSEATQFFISKIGTSSQIHTGGFIYRKYNHCPLMKRDLLFREQFTIDEIEYALNNIGHEGHLDEIMADFRRKGKSSQLPMIRKLKAASGII